MVQTLSCGITAVSDIWGSRLGAWNIYQPLLSPTALCGQGMPGHGSLSTIENHRSVPPPQMCNSEGPHLQSAGQICLVSEQVGWVKKTNVASQFMARCLVPISQVNTHIEGIGAVHCTKATAAHPTLRRPRPHVTLPRHRRIRRRSPWLCNGDPTSTRSPLALGLSEQTLSGRTLYCGNPFPPIPSPRRPGARSRSGHISWKAANPAFSFHQPAGPVGSLGLRLRGPKMAWWATATLGVCACTDRARSRSAVPVSASPRLRALLFSMSANPALSLCLRVFPASLGAVTPICWDRRRDARTARVPL